MYVKITNGIPETYTIGQLRKDNPNISFPKNVPDERLADYDVYPLSPPIEPAYDPETQYLAKGPIQFDGTVWRKTYVVTDLDPAAITQRRESSGETMRSIIQAHLDEAAIAKGYQSILDCVSYVGSSVVKFNNEATAAFAWRDAVWLAARDIIRDVKNGTRVMPDKDTLISELPTITWP